MERGQVLDLINFVNTVILFGAPIILNAYQQPLGVQALPALLFVVPLVIVWYKRRLETEKNEKISVVKKVEKLHPLLVKLERVKIIPTIARNLLDDEKFSSAEVAIGWREYFEAYGQKINGDLGYFMYSLSYFTEKVGKSKGGVHDQFYVELLTFYHIVSDFHDLYNNLARMIELAGGIPQERREVIESSRKLELNYKDFVRVLKDLCDEDEEIGKEFKGKKPLIVPLKKLRVRKIGPVSPP